MPSLKTNYRLWASLWSPTSPLVPLLSSPADVIFVNLAPETFWSLDLAPKTFGLGWPALLSLYLQSHAHTHTHTYTRTFCEWPWQTFRHTTCFILFSLSFQNQIFCVYRGQIKILHLFMNHLFINTKNTCMNYNLHHKSAYFFWRPICFTWQPKRPCTYLR